MKTYHASALLAALTLAATVPAAAAFAQSSGRRGADNAPTISQNTQGMSGQNYHPPGHWEGYLGDESAKNAPAKSHQGNASAADKH